MADQDVAASIGVTRNVSRESLDRLHVYTGLLVKWQRRINLIGPSTVSQIWERHIDDALALSALLPKGTESIVDLGSGAGIPGLVLAIAHGDQLGFHVHLVESNGKKASFLREAIRRTNAPASVHNKRIEQACDDIAIANADVVVARALGTASQATRTGRTHPQ